MENIFNKTANITTMEDKYNYLKNHKQYWTMNSWNYLKSVANNVKIYNLELTNDQEQAIYKFMEEDYDTYADSIMDQLLLLIKKHNLRNIFFNGRSSGYLVLGDQEYHNGNALGDLFAKYDSIEAYKEHLTEYDELSELEANDLIQQVIDRDFDLVKRFDQVCDELRQFVLSIAKPE